MKIDNSSVLSSDQVAGFSLIELMMTIAILAILLTLAAPSFQRLIATNRMASSANELLGSMQLGRNEALKRRVPVSLCPSTDGATCGGTWAGGWIVTVDDSVVGTATVSVDEVLRVWDGLRGDLEFEAPASLPAFVRFLPDGRVDVAGGAPPYDFQIQLPSCKFNVGREVEIVGTGRSAVREIPC